MQLNSVLKKIILSSSLEVFIAIYVKKQGVNGNENCFLSLKLTLGMFTEADIPFLKKYFSLLLNGLGFRRELLQSSIFKQLKDSDWSSADGIRKVGT